MFDFILWYLLLTLIGWLAFPIAFRLFPFLAGRGFAFARPLGLLLWGYLFWLLTSLHITPNAPSGMLLALLLVAAASLWFLGNDRWREFVTWSKQQSRLILISEVLFILAFAGWSLVRATNPKIEGTEKPMEMAFINAILRSPGFPPNDPWLSGYAISYYYFGYVIVAMLIRITGVPSEVAFNLATAAWFALIALTSYGLVLALVDGWIKRRRSPSQVISDVPTPALGWGLLGPLFVLITSNLEGFLEVLHAGGLFWQKAADGVWKSSFWQWLNIQELIQPPSFPFSWMPNRPGGIIWWRASRVLQDINLAGRPWEIIDEFPFFSFLLSDLHPHVLAMPFALLALGLAANIFFMGSRFSFSELTWKSWIKRLDFWLAALVFGGLAFLNTWDFPIYVAIFSAAYTLVRFQQEGWQIKRLLNFVFLSFYLGAAGVLLYLPFYLGFASQAGGILPSMSFFTRGVYFWVMFAPLLVPILAWFIWMWSRRGRGEYFFTGLRVACWVIGLLWISSFTIGAVGAGLPSVGDYLVNSQPIGSSLGNLGLSLKSWGELFIGLHGSDTTATLVLGSILQRLSSPGTWLTLGILFTLALGLTISYKPEKKQEIQEAETLESDRQSDKNNHLGSPNVFVILLILTGVLLTLVPEFFYLRDQFGWRMNTIFKFYFQTWIIWAIAAAYCSSLLWQVLKRSWKIVFRAGWIMIMLMALVYPVTMLSIRTNEFKPSEWTLDGAAYLRRYSPDEWDAIHWLRQAPFGIVAEAIGGSYSGYGIISTYSGLPTVLNWPGHESQWRGGAQEIGSRESDIQRLYRTSDWQEALSVLQQYNIRYVVVGSLERGAYRVNEGKFQSNLQVVFQKGMVFIYEVPLLENSDVISLSWK